MNPTRHALLSGLVVSLFLACSKRPAPASTSATVRPSSEASEVARPAVALPTAPASSVTESDDPRRALKRILDQWLEATNAADGARLSELFAPEVEFYGAILARSRAVELKRRAHPREGALVESLVGEPVFFRRFSHGWRIEFTKRVVVSGVSTEYQAYLLVATSGRSPRPWGSDGGPLRIVAESDRTTDTRLGTGACEFVMRRTLEELCAVHRLGVDDYILASSPESNRLRKLQEVSDQYVFEVGSDSDLQMIFHALDKIRLNPDTGSAEIECPTFNTVPWEDLCKTRASNGSKRKFYPVAFTPSARPGDDAACAAVVEQLGRRATSP